MVARLNHVENAARLAMADVDEQAPAPVEERGARPVNWLPFALAALLVCALAASALI